MERLSCSQFLFGYDRGHSLIAGSEKLPARTEAFLSRHSDAAPGISLDSSEQYWSGLPVSSTEYALISTWPAPEMPRPGCVWSHVILLSRDALVAVPDLSVLQMAFHRPVNTENYNDFRRPVVIPTTGQLLRVRASRDALIETLRAVYDPDAKGQALYRHRDRDQAAFEVWSQQWPALRHAFRFNTALQSRQTSERAAEGWLQYLEPRHSTSPNQTIPSWLAELCLGLERQYPLYDVLQQAGPDLPPEPSTVRLLARLFAFTRGNEIDHDLRAIKFAARELPSAKDGQRLKEWLLSETLRLTNRRQALNLVEFLLTDVRSEAFAGLKGSVSGKLATVWENDADKLFQIIEEANERSTPRFEYALNLLAKEAPADVLSWKSENGAWRGRILLAEVRPDLLLETQLNPIPTDVLNKLIDISIRREQPSIMRLIAELLSRNPDEHSLALFNQHDAIFVRALVSTICASPKKEAIHSNWNYRFNEIVGLVITDALEMCETTSSICLVLEYLHWPRESLMIGTARRWLSFLKKSEDDMNLRHRQRLYAIILNVAFLEANESSIGLLEHVVPDIYGWMKSGSLEYDVAATAMSNVGYYFTIPIWDHCRRLKRSLREFYEVYGFESQRWERLKSKL